MCVISFGGKGEKGCELRDMREDVILLLQSTSDSAAMIEEVRTVLKVRSLPEKSMTADKYIFARPEW